MEFMSFIFFWLLLPSMHHYKVLEMSRTKNSIESNRDLLNRFILKAVCENNIVKINN